MAILPEAVLGNSSKILDVARHLVAREPGLAMGNDALGRDAFRLVWPCCNTMQTLTSSPRFSSGTGTAAASTISGKAAKHGFDLARGDILAGATDHLLDPADEIEIAACILPEEVAGAEPIAVESGPVASGLL